MLLKYFGLFESESSLIEILETNDKIGTKHQSIIDELTRQGLYCYVNKEAKIEDVKYFIDKKLPVMVHFIEPSGDEGHYSLVIGYTRSSLILNDPWNGEKFEIQEEDFLNRWKDEERESQKWFLVVSKEDFGLGRQYKPD